MPAQSPRLPFWTGTREGYDGLQCRRLPTDPEGSRQTTASFVSLGGGPP